MPSNPLPPNGGTRVGGKDKSMMIRWIQKILTTFDYHTLTDFLHSIYPGLKYEQVTVLTITFGMLGGFVDTVFGITGVAMILFIAVMITELVSGIWASTITEKQRLESFRLSRFSFKMFCYLVIISATYLLGESYAVHDNATAAGAFKWLHVFMVIHIVFENVISILENVAVINGEKKDYWIKKIREKLLGL